MVSSASIKAKARELGFDACGIAPASDHPELPFFARWIAQGYAGSMAYLSRSLDRRGDVRRVVPTACTVIATATVYNTARPYSVECADPARAHLSRYAWGDDYHEVIGARLNRLLDWMRHEHGVPFEARAYVDTGPVQERVYAQHAGLGWIGKNTCLIHPELGSWVFLGEIICSLPLDTDESSLDRCGTCTLCLEACPTQAFVGPGVLDATRCISYWTIEHRGDIPDEVAPGLGTHVYGCDICQEVCPWNATAPTSPERAWQPRPAWDAPSVEALAEMAESDMQEALVGSPMQRTGASGLQRNIAVARRAVAAKKGL